MGLFDGDGEEPSSKRRRFVMTASFFVMAAAATLWYFLRYETEKDTVRTFMEAVARADLKAAYALWQPRDPANYDFNEFVSDWGDKGYYGPVRSYRVTAAHMPKRGSSGVIVAVEVCPETPFRNDPARNKEVLIWVERKDQRMSFPP